jgi:hypothetical protein
MVAAIRGLPIQGLDRREAALFNSGSQVPLRCTQILLHFIPQNFWRTATRCAQYFLVVHGSKN